MVTYTFSGTGVLAGIPELPPISIAFQLSVPDFINPQGSEILAYPASQMDSSQNCLAAIFTKNDVLQFNATNQTGYMLYFPGGAFGAAGKYDCQKNDGESTGTLTVAVSMAAAH